MSELQKKVSKGAIFEHNKSAKHPAATIFICYITYLQNTSVSFFFHKLRPVFR